MTLRKKIAFGLLTALLLGVVLEGVARVIWWWLESRAFSVRMEDGAAAILRNDGINFMKEVHPQLGYVLKPGFERGNLYVNRDGFAQRDVVPRERVQGKLRVVAMGESTTHGHHVDEANYPVYLRGLLAAHAHGYNGAEVVNAGVSGWLSDQVAIYAETRVAGYRPDVVVLYTGWNDFNSYDPFNPPAEVSFFDSWYRGRGGWIHATAEAKLKSVALLSALYQKVALRFGLPTARVDSSQERVYRFYLRNLDRILAAYRQENPDVRIAISTLVGRWPQGSQEEFEKPSGRLSWMVPRRTTPQEAAQLLSRFNDLIRAYAARHRLVLIDAAEEFEPLDRARLQWDLAHMHSEGYELLAGTMYEALRRAGVVSGDPSPRRDELLAKYRLAVPVTAAPASTGG